MRGGSINGPEDFNGIVCARCFTVLAEERRIASLFRLDARRVEVELETVTPSGRVWDAERWLWVEPAPATNPSESGEVVRCEQCDRRLDAKPGNAVSDEEGFPICTDCGGENGTPLFEAVAPDSGGRVEELEKALRQIGHTAHERITELDKDSISAHWVRDKARSALLDSPSSPEGDQQ